MRQKNELHPARVGVGKAHSNKVPEGILSHYDRKTNKNGFL